VQDVEVGAGKLPALPARFARVIKANHPDPREFAFEPLAVTVRVATPLVMTWPWLNFDGLVAHLFLKRLLGELYYLLPAKDPLGVVDGMTLPLARDPRGFYKASASHLENYLRKTLTIYKRFETRDLARVDPGRATKINLQSGTFKSCAIQFVYFPPQPVRFWCIGDRALLRVLLEEDLAYLGKKRAAGYGEVVGVTVEPSAGDFSVVRRGILARPVPVRFLTNAERVMNVPWYPPYWAKGTAEPCGVPFAGGKLRA